MQAPELFAGVKALAEQAFSIYEELGDKQGSMSALITLAYAHVADPSAQGMAGRIEHVRALHHSSRGDVTDSQSAVDDAHMLYGIHTYARLNLQPALALERGREAFDAARALGDRWLEALAAGGMAMTCLQVEGATTAPHGWKEPSPPRCPSPRPRWPAVSSCGVGPTPPPGMTSTP